MLNATAESTSEKGIYSPIKWNKASTILAGMRVTWKAKQAPDWGAQGRESPSSWLQLSREELLGCSSCNVELEFGVQGAGGGSAATDSCCSYSDLVHFCEWMFLHSLYALRAIVETLNDCFIYNFYQINYCFTGERVHHVAYSASLEVTAPSHSTAWYLASSINLYSEWHTLFKFPLLPHKARSMRWEVAEKLSLWNNILICW